VLKSFNPKLIPSGISRRNSRFASGTILTLFTSILFEISRTRFLGTLSDYVLIKIAKMRQNDNFTFAVGLRLYTKHQHQRANNLFDSIDNFKSLAPRAVYLISLCASFQMNLRILERIEMEIDIYSIKLFVRGLILHQSSPEDSIDCFIQVHSRYLTERGEEVRRRNLPEYVRNSINVSKPLLQSPSNQPQDGLLGHLESKSTNFVVLPSGVSDLILISYTSSYLFALSDQVIGRIRKAHDHAILLIISISQFEDESAISIFCRNLSLKFGNVFWKLVISQFDLPISSSVVRLVIAQELFDVHFTKSILVLDGDTSFIKVDPVQVWEDIGRNFDIALLQNESFCPWERISLGFTILNNTERTKEFLLRFDLYVTTHFLEDRAFWTLDQTAAFLVLQAMLKNNRDYGSIGIHIFDLSSLVSLREFIFTDKLLVNLKLRAKASNLDFISELAEDLYLP
jgi:hypothetical protein